MSDFSHFKVLKPVLSPRGFVIVPVHYSHDSEKDENWKRAERAKYQDDASWQREQEIDFGSISGAPAYPNFRREVHLKENVKLYKDLPLCLCVDFNVEPMIWEIAQIRGDSVWFIDEIKLNPGSTQEAIHEFRRRYPAHAGGVRIYGDATGKARTSPTAHSDYDIIRLNLRNYPTEVKYFIPPVNPPVKDRLNAFNARLLDPNGAPRVFIHPTLCPELVRDLVEVVLDPSNPGNVYKVRRRDDPYFYRTHASDAAGYLIAFEWPVVSELAKLAGKKQRRRVPYRVLGDLM